jgi:hypothetical protein
MRTITVTLYQYDELSDAAKERALSGLRDLNVNHEWWEYVYEDAARIGLEIRGFDEYRCVGSLTLTVGEICRRILKDHGKTCDTYRTAVEYYTRKREGRPFDEADFARTLLEDYRIILNKEYDYLTGDEAVEESIRANEYEFTEEGAMQ